MSSLKNILITCLLLISSFSSLEARETIKWLKWELAPEYIKSGKLKKQGFADQYLESLIKKMPSYNHEIVWVNTKRFMVEMKKSKRCAAFVWKGFDIIDYSKPYTMTPPNGITIHKKNIQKFGNPGTELSFKKLLQNSKLVLAMLPLSMDKRESQISRYPTLGSLIKPHLANKHVIQIPSALNEVDLKFLDRRADYAITYPVQAYAYSKMKGIPYEFIFYPLKEASTYRSIYVGCNKSVWAKKFIAKIVNPILNREFKLQVLSTYKEWAKDDFRFFKLYENHFINEDIEMVIKP